MKIKHKRSNVLDGGKAKEPTAAQMEYGELAVNYNTTDPSVFIKDSADNIVKIADATPPGDGTITIKQPGSPDQSFTVNQAGNTEINLKNDNTQVTPGNGALSIKTYGSGDASTGSYTANQAGAGTVTLPQISYTDLKDKPSIPTPGAGVITIKQPGTTDQSFNVNQSGPTEINLKNDNTVVTPGAGVITIKQPGVSDQSFNVNQSGPTEINLKNDNTIVTPGNGALSIKTYGSGDTSTGTFTANQSGASSLTLPQIDFGDLKNVPPAGAAPGNGTITIKQPGTVDQSFTVNQTGNTEINLKNDNTQVTPGNGALTIRTAGEGANATGSFTANQSSGGTLTLPTIRYGDLSGRPTIPAAAGNGTITITQPGTTNQTFTVNQSGNTTINLKNDNTVVTPGNGALNIRIAGQANTQTGTFTANQSTAGTITIPEISYTGITDKPTIPAAAGNGTITIKQPGTSDQTFTVNQSGNTEINLKNDNTDTTYTASNGVQLTGTNFTADSTVVRTTGNQNIAGNKRFTQSVDCFNTIITGFGDDAAGIAIGRYANAKRTTAAQNIAIGFETLSENLTGNGNTAVGVQSLWKATAPRNCVAVGALALSQNNQQNCVAVGKSAAQICDAISTTAIGTSALSALTTGTYNTSVGWNSAGALTSGTSNVSIGATSMQNASISLRNTAIGYSSLLNLTEGNNNVAIGEKAGNTLTTGSNNICIGKEGNGIVSVFEGTTESNFISMGHRSITDAYVKVAWTVVSDERDKTNFKTVPHGLDFVNKLKPISYQFKVNRTSDKATGPIRYGFKAQDILELEGDNPVIIDTKDENLLKYKGEHLVPILVNAIQELSQELDELKKSLPIK